MSWVPGQPVVTAQDQVEWREWCHQQKLDSQRFRRKLYRRIDYYPSKEAQAVIDKRAGNFVGGTYSEVIDALLLFGARKASGIK